MQRIGSKVSRGSRTERTRVSMFNVKRWWDRDREKWADCPRSSTSDWLRTPARQMRRAQGKVKCRKVLVLQGRTTQAAPGWRRTSLRPIRISWTWKKNGWIRIKTNTWISKRDSRPKKNPVKGLKIFGIMPQLSFIFESEGVKSKTSIIIYFLKTARSGNLK